MTQVKLIFYSGDGARLYSGQLVGKLKVDVKQEVNHEL